MLSTKEAAYQANDLVSYGAWKVVSAPAWNPKKRMSICPPKTMKAEGREMCCTEFRTSLSAPRETPGEGPVRGLESWMSRPRIPSWGTLPS